MRNKITNKQDISCYMHQASILGLYNINFPHENIWAPLTMSEWLWFHNHLLTYDTSYKTRYADIYQTVMYVVIGYEIQNEGWRDAFLMWLEIHHDKRFWKAFLDVVPTIQVSHDYYKILYNKCEPWFNETFNTMSYKFLLEKKIKYVQEYS